MLYISTFTLTYFDGSTLNLLKTSQEKKYLLHIRKNTSKNLPEIECVVCIYKTVKIFGFMCL